MQTLTIYKKIDSTNLSLPELKSWIGKEALIKIMSRKINEKKKPDRLEIGVYDFGGKLDEINIRYFANED